MTIETINSVLAGIGAVLLANVASRMTGTTCHRFRFAMVLIFTGLFGDFLSLWLSGWQAYIHTLLYAGLVAWLWADRRSCA